MTTFLTVLVVCVGLFSVYWIGIGVLILATRRVENDLARKDDENTNTP